MTLQTHISELINLRQENSIPLFLIFLMIIYTIPNIYGLYWIYQNNLLVDQAGEIERIKAIYSVFLKLRNPLAGFIIPLFTLMMDHKSITTISYKILLGITCLFTLCAFSMNYFFEIASFRIERMNPEEFRTIQLAVSQYVQDSITFIGVIVASFMKCYSENTQN